MKGLSDNALRRIAREYTFDQPLTNEELLIAVDWQAVERLLKEQPWVNQDPYPTYRELRLGTMDEDLDEEAVLYAREQGVEIEQDHGGVTYAIEYQDNFPHRPGQ